MGHVNTPLGKRGLSAHALKTIAIVAMVIDHIAWALVPTRSLLGQAMHVLGRLTAPIMCFFIAEGYHHTRNLKKYAMRLGAFALISHVPFYYYENGRLPWSAGKIYLAPTSVIYTLFLGLIALVVHNNDKLSSQAKALTIAGLCAAAIPGDWAFFTVLWVLAFGANRGDFEKQASAYNRLAFLLPTLIIATRLIARASDWPAHICQFGVLLAIPVLRRYNGQLGGNKSTKWFFYVFYPLHLLIIGLIRWHR